MRVPGRTARRAALVVALLLAPGAQAADIPLPTAPLPQPPPPAAPAPAEPAPTTSPEPAASPVLLRPGARGGDVGRLQRALSRRGIPVRIDGHYGRQTVRGVRVVQRRFKRPVTGLADADLLRRLGVKIRTVATTAPGQPLGGVPPSATPSASTYLMAFPVAGTGYGYSDDFGDPRHQGRHEGCDIVDRMGTGLQSVVDGTVTRVQRTERGLGGIYIWIRDAKGNDYYYAHMETILPEIQEGVRVRAGQPVGTMGMTGDAKGTIPHLHFEIRPAGSRPINPYPELVTVDPKRAKA